MVQSTVQFNVQVQCGTVYIRTYVRTYVYVHRARVVHGTSIPSQSAKAALGCLEWAGLMT